MSRTIDLQRKFITSVLSNIVPEAVFEHHHDIEARLRVYRRNFMQSHCVTLKKIFAVTALYLKDTFDTLAMEYVCRHPPKNGEVFGVYGKFFSSFLSDPVSKELARLEWSLRELLRIPDEDESSLITSNRNPESICWQLRTDVLLFKSPYPVGELYLTLQKNNFFDKIWPKQSCYVLARHETVPILFPLSAAEYTVLECLRDPCTIGALVDKLTFKQEILVKIIPAIFKPSFLKVADVNNSYDTPWGKGIRQIY